MKKFFVIAYIFCAISAYGQQSELLDNYRTVALSYNHDLKAAQKSIMASMELEKSARADKIVKLSGGVDFNFTGNPMQLTMDLPSLVTPMQLSGRQLSYGASVSLLQPVYTGGRLLETIRMAQHQKSFNTSQAEAIANAICYQTDIQYWNTVARYEIVGVSEEFKNSIANLVNTIQERVEVGLVDPQELLMAQVKLNEANYQLLQSQSNFETGRMALNSFLGFDLSDKTEIDKTIPTLNASDTLLLSFNTPGEVKMAQQKIKISETSLRLNDSKYKPQIFVGAEGNYSSPGYNFKADLNPNYAFYAKLSVPILEWGKRRSDKRAANYQVGMASDNLNKIEDAVSLEVKTAKVSLEQALERVRLTESSLAKANENETKALERYQEGKVSIVEVIDAQTYRQTAQINYVQAKVSVQGYYSDLRKALNSYNNM